MRYTEWVQKVAYAALENRPRHIGFGIHQLGEALGFDWTSVDEAGRRRLTLALDHALADLASHGIVDYDHNAFFIGYPPGARVFRTEPLTTMWHQCRANHLEPDEEDCLAVLAQLSEQQAPDLADTVAADMRDAFDALKWEWDLDLAFRIWVSLRDRESVRGYPPTISDGGEISVTYCGLVRAMDDVGADLREAEAHLQTRRLRAAGCIAAVELERRLKALLGDTPQVRRRRDPGIKDYALALWTDKRIDQETWEDMDTLAAIRKRCVHVLDREPTIDEARQLLEGVERILRKYPVPEE